MPGRKPCFERADRLERNPRSRLARRRSDANRLRPDRPRTRHYQAPPGIDLIRNEDFLEWFNHPPKDLDGLCARPRACVVEVNPMKMAMAAWAAHCSIAHWRRTRIAHHVFTACRRDSNQCVTSTTTRSVPFPPAPGRHAMAALVPGPSRTATRSSEHTLNRVISKAQFWVRNSGPDAQRKTEKGPQRAARCQAAGFCRWNDEQEYASLTKTSPATAQRDLADLVQKAAWC